MPRADVRDICAVLQWVENPKDRNARRRVLQLLPGVGKVTAERMLALVTARRLSKTLAEFTPHFKAAKGWTELVVLLQSLRAKKAAWPGQMVAVCRWYESYLDNDPMTAAANRRMIDSLQRIAAGSQSRSKFLADMALETPPDDTDQLVAPQSKADTLVLSTIHSVKGQQFDAVFILNAIQGCMPYSRAGKEPNAIEEERRMLYVAMTRAKRQLALLMPQSSGYAKNVLRPLGNRPPIILRTRFIPDACLAHFDSVSLV